MHVRIGLIRLACAALVMLNLVARWCDVSCCGPGVACADGCDRGEGECCVVADSDGIAGDADRDVPADDADRPASDCSAVCCAKVIVAQTASLLSTDRAPQCWLAAASDVVPDLLTTSGIFHPPRG